MNGCSLRCLGGTDLSVFMLKQVTNFHYAKHVFVQTGTFDAERDIYSGVGQTMGALTRELFAAFDINTNYYCRGMPFMEIKSCVLSGKAKKEQSLLFRPDTLLTSCICNLRVP